jgi:hypothetical protein
MSDWINEVEDRLQREESNQERLARRDDVLRSRASAYWYELTEAVKEQISRINKSERIQLEVKCELKYHEENVSSFRVEKQVFPSITLSVSRSGDKIMIRKVRTDVKNPETYFRDGLVKSSREEKEELQLILDENEGLAIRGKNQQLLSPEDIPRYLLEPLLVPATEVRNPYRFN